MSNDHLPADQGAMRGTRVRYCPPFVDTKENALGVVSSEAAFDDGNWFVLVRFDGDDRWVRVDVRLLRILA